MGVMDNAREAELRRQLSDEAKRIAIDAEYSGRQHLGAGQDWRHKATLMGLPVVLITAALSAGAGLAALVGGATWIIAALGFAGAIAGAALAYYRPDELATGHSTKGARYISLRNEARRFRKVDMNTGASLDALADRLRLLGSRLDALKELEPRELPKGLYEKVKAEIAAGNYSYDNDPLWEREGADGGDDRH